MKFISLFYFAFIAKLCTAGCFGGDIIDGEILDIANPDLSKVTVEEKTDDRIKCKVFKPKEGVTITSFKEGEVELAKTKSALKRLKIQLDSPTLVEIAHGGMRYKLNHYEKSGGAWTKVSYDNFYKKIDEIKNNAVKPEAVPEVK